MWIGGAARYILICRSNGQLAAASPRRCGGEAAAMRRDTADYWPMRREMAELRRYLSGDEEVACEGRLQCTGYHCACAIGIVGHLLPYDRSRLRAIECYQKGPDNNHATSASKTAGTRRAVPPACKFPPDTN